MPFSFNLISRLLENIWVEVFFLASEKLKKVFLQASFLKEMKDNLEILLDTPPFLQYSYLSFSVCSLRFLQLCLLL